MGVNRRRLEREETRARKIVQNLLGHSDIATPSYFYADVLLEDVRAALETTAPM